MTTRERQQPPDDGVTAKPAPAGAGAAASLADAADRAAASGDLNEARALLEQAAAAAKDDPALWLRLAAICRASRDLGGALDATHRALAIQPLDFTALLLRATLLDGRDDPAAAEAWTYALAQQPEGELPPQIQRVVEQGRARVQARQAEREQRMKAAMADAEQRASPEEQSRIERFRSNALRVTRPFHSSPTHFHYPGLREFEFHPRSSFPWLDQLEAATAAITAELKAVMAAERAELVPYIQYQAHEPLAQWRELNHSDDWTAIHLLQNGSKVEANAGHCPVTLETLAACNQPQIPGTSPNAMFSLLAPNTAIPPHVGVNNARLVCHLPLIVPDGCWFRVGAETRYWKPGEALVFDDTIEHEANNPSDELRVVLIFDVWHPDLSATERDAVAALLASENAPGSGGL